MRLIKLFLLAVILIGLVIASLANQQAVTVSVLPQNLAGWIGWSYDIQLPLFVVIFAGILVGLVLGYILEWLREHRYRAEASKERRARTKLEREMDDLKGKTRGDQDEVLALLDDTARRT